MTVTTTQLMSYQINCDVNNKANDCEVITNLKFYIGNTYMSSSTTAQKIPLAKMQAIVAALKE